MFQCAYRSVSRKSKNTYNSKNTHDVIRWELCQLLADFYNSFTAELSRKSLTFGKGLNE